MGCNPLTPTFGFLNTCGDLLFGELALLARHAGDGIEFADRPQDHDPHRLAQRSVAQTLQPENEVIGTRFGVIWPGGSFTGGITDHQRLAMRYAQTDGGQWYQVGGTLDPERATTKPPAVQEENFDDIC